jgi:glycosyltransferase involved in cell wall biosynthesis
VRLAFVVQRYGTEVGGGAELHCRWLAERLAKRHHVEVFATRALNYIDWANAYPPGTARVNGIPVHRFGVARRRKSRVFASISNTVFDGPHSLEEEEAWVRANGPESPALVRAVAEGHERFDLFFFYCYRYYHTFYGLPRVADRAVLVPTAEEDPAIGLAIFHPLFRQPRGIVYLTPEEQALVEEASGNSAVPSVTIGSGLDLPDVLARDDFRARHGLTRPFLLYVGRIDRNKGCAALFAYFQRFLQETLLDVDLVLAGTAALAIPDHPRIRHIGFISEEEKVAAMRAAEILVMPSPYESLSIVLLEAWKQGLPALANARCRVLAGQCLRSGGGLFYDGYAEFREAARLLLSRPDLRAALGRQGREYVEGQYSWERVDAAMEGFLAKMAEAPAASEAGVRPLASAPGRGGGSGVRSDGSRRA